MMRLLTPMKVLLGGFSILLVTAARAADRPLRVADSIDLQRYMGKWYEIGRLPNRFQRACAGDVSATYTLRPDGKISVLNQCRESSGKIRSVSGTAKRASGSGPNTKIKVTFFWPFYGDYWILDIDPTYSWALVGEPGRKYLWVLSRTPQMEPSLFHSILEKAHAAGFDTNRVVITPQGGNSAE